MRMLTSGSADSLDLYDDRYGSLGSPDKLGTTPSSIDRVNLLLNRSIKGGESYARAAHLETLAESAEDGLENY